MQLAGCQLSMLPAPALRRALGRRAAGSRRRAGHQVHATGAVAVLLGVILTLHMAYRLSVSMHRAASYIPHTFQEVL